MASVCIVACCDFMHRVATRYCVIVSTFILLSQSGQGFIIFVLYYALISLKSLTCFVNDIYIFVDGW